VSVGHLYVFFGEMPVYVFCPFLTFLIIYLLKGEGASGRERERRSEADSALSAEPNVGLYPTTVRLQPEPNQESNAQPTEPPRHPFCPFLIGLFVFLVLSCRSSLYILDTNPLSDMALTNTFSHSVACLSVLLIVSFAVQSFLF